VHGFWKLSEYGIRVGLPEFCYQPPLNCPYLILPIEEAPKATLRPRGMRLSHTFNI